jgi:threonyl-tRNA synthetase
MAAGTIQYDPNLPERFDLSYVGEDGEEHRPVVLHRAIFGSLERFFGVYLEHYGGSFPAWLAPKQAIVLTVSEKSDAYARQVVDRLRARGLRAHRHRSRRRRLRRRGRDRRGATLPIPRARRGPRPRASPRRDGSPYEGARSEVTACTSRR